MLPDKLQVEQQRVFIGRQPILNRDQTIYAYELLFRSGESNEAFVRDDNYATAQVIYNTLIEIGLDDIVGEKHAFINFPYDLLVNDIAKLLPPDKVVIEILEDVHIDDRLTGNVKELAGRGYKLALDDFIFKPEWEPILPFVSIIKFDVFNQTREEMQEHLKKLDKYDVELLAEKVESYEEFETLNELGFNFFQGYFFSRPRVIKKKKLPDNHIALLQLLSRLQDKDIEIYEVEELVSHTVSLNYKLFRYINSAYLGLSRKFDSIRQAVVYFGLQRLKDLASLIAMTDMEGKSSGLIVTGLSRAKMCELLAKKAGLSEKEGFFVTGLFSILDALLDHSFEEILKQLPLKQDIVKAIMNYEGYLGKALECSIACETCHWGDIKFADLEAMDIYESYLESITWSRKALEGI